MKIKILSLLFLSLFLFNCSSDSAEVPVEEEMEEIAEEVEEEEIEEEEEEEEEEEVNETLITYVNDVAPIIMNNCIECHGEVGFRANVQLHTYDLLVSQYMDVQFRINSSVNPMPPSGLMSEENRRVFDEWIIDGLLEN